MSTKTATTPSLPVSTKEVEIPQLPPHLMNLACQVKHNLQFQHTWNQLTIQTQSPLTQHPFIRPLVAGLPPKRIYIHPDEQTELLKYDSTSNEVIDEAQEFDKDIVKMSGQPEMEWVLPTHVEENWSLRSLAHVFDAISTMPPNIDSNALKDGIAERQVGWQWRGEHRQKRLLMATVHDDSTIVYYIVHDGIVKPRQN
ncbi:tRNA splicing endonuclease [Blumeria hordei DH14]|uniref:tRNA splicing endonuclease n=1 Tax=Blumeria graminis f. sp. hordei (strain DH14) TaxID=546991 RepID=N1JG68_BLUG1|nr:tRNA splicing endonuclease [Blumeria hordei DH14]